MHTIHKKIVTDEAMRPIAVQIPYNDWLEIERLLQHELEKKPQKKQQLSRYAGTIHLTEDPVKYQRRIRKEWK
jgi:hypothetical protein